MPTSYRRAAVVKEPSQISFTRVAVPEPRKDEVRVRLAGCGVCGSNLAPWEGRPWFRYPLAPGELGHEGWGRVDAVGPEVRRIRPGDLVALLSYHAYAEYDLARENAIVKLPESLANRPFPGEALGCSMNVFRRCDIRAGQTVAVVGIGFLGALLTSLSVRAGARVLAFSR
ncbi:MAG TPA: alcohol dehydrogenase catalytic domain-containing protein, partial [Verrucomicrobiae bacterium]|nr:alcohol dehydrogenase catalytic domain-containing protein [Verrucomicrobiae bacterium]